MGARFEIRRGRSVSSNGSTRIALLPSEPIREKMAGIGIRYAELARRLPKLADSHGHRLDVVLINPGDVQAEGAADVLDGLGCEVRTFERGRLNELTADCDGIVTQGQLANDVVIECPDLPTAIDFYDPFLVENLSYYDTLGLDPYRNDHATWTLQFTRGDFFLCSSDEQRQFYLGVLTALGRLNPERVKQDPDLQTLVAAVPFGVPDTLPDPEPLLGERRPGQKRLLFGGLYDWYDPWPVLEAFATCDEPEWTLLFVRNPNPEATPQKLFRDVESWCRERKLWGTRVEVLDWIPSNRRFDLLREVDLLVSTHRINLETRLSLRTRFLDALAAGCPVVTSAGGAMSRLLHEHGAGWVTPPGDAAALENAFREILTGPDAQQRIDEKRRGGHALLEHFTWERALAPLVRFCENPWRDNTKDEFAVRPETVAPPDPLAFRIRRRVRQSVRRWLG